MATDVCPGCEADMSAPDGKSHRIGVEIRGVYDGVLFWECPFCGHHWHRFGEDNPHRHRAVPYVDGEV